MASDAFMEISDKDTWGETYDARFFGHDPLSGSHPMVEGEKERRKGAFEISSFELGLNTNELRDWKKQLEKANEEAKKNRKPLDRPEKPHDQMFTIKKPIDLASKNLFRLACEHRANDVESWQTGQGRNTEGWIEWGVITLREAGDKNPWLVLEFGGLWVEKFEWDVNPAVSRNEAKDQEVITFSFRTIYYKYFRQEASGKHTSAGMFPYDFADLKNDIVHQEVPNLNSETW